MPTEEMPEWKRQAIQRDKEDRQDYQRICAEVWTEMAEKDKKRDQNR